MWFGFVGGVVIIPPPLNIWPREISTDLVQIQHLLNPHMGSYKRDAVELLEVINDSQGNQ
jgi:hypothetical protein